MSATYELKINCNDPKELAHILAAVVSIHGSAEVTGTSHGTAVATPKVENKPAETPKAEDKPAETPTAPKVTVEMLQAVGRKLAAAGRGNDVQRLVQKYGAKFISKTPEDKREVLYSELMDAAAQLEAQNDGT